MKYLVTGIAGHACPHLVKILLNDGHEVHALIRSSNGRELDLLDVMSPDEVSSIAFHYGDLLDSRSIDLIFQENKFDGVFHLAAQSHPPTSFRDPVLTMQTNVCGTMYIVEAIRKYNPSCVLMNCSTSEVYGDMCKETGYLTEDMKLIPSNPYGWSKMCAETYVSERCKNGLLKGFSTRSFSHLAPRRGKNFSISWDAYHLAEMKLGINKGRDLPVGNLKTKRIVVDARDVMKAYYLLMQEFHKKDKETRVTNPINGESFNVCGDISTVKEMEFFTDKLIEISGLKGVKKVIDKRVYRPIDIQIQVGETYKLKRTIKWKPEIPIEKTLKDIYEYWIKKLK